MSASGRPSGTPASIATLALAVKNVAIEPPWSPGVWSTRACFAVAALATPRTFVLVASAHHGALEPISTEPASQAVPERRA
jgi:hypothetical protein